MPNEQYLPCELDLTCGTLCRSPDHLLRVTKQLDVEHSARYQPQKDATGKIVRTYCNIFLADCLQALGITAPLHWWLSQELSANALGPWLAVRGSRYGWSEVDESTARARASLGQPVFALFVNSSGDGHVALVLPSPPDGPTMTAQAGAACFYNGDIRNGFGMYPRVFWAHG